VFTIAIDNLDKPRNKKTNEMGNVYFVILSFLLLLPQSAKAEITISEPKGNADPAFVEELKTSLERVIQEMVSAESANARLETSAKENDNSIEMEMILVPEDTSGEIRESRQASKASALAQARAMARLVVLTFISRIETKNVEAKNYEKTLAVQMAAQKDNVARGTARPGIVLGMGMEVTGLLSGIVLWAIFLSKEEYQPEAAIGEYASGGLMVLGTVFTSAALTMRQRAYQKAGLSLGSGKMAINWLLSTLTTATYALFVAAWVRHDSEEPGSTAKLSEDIGYVAETAMIAWVFGASLMTEIVNLGIWRALWYREFQRAEKRTHTKVTASPLITMDTHGRHLVSGFTLSLSF
jgi:hypothetical protein